MRIPLILKLPAGSPAVIEGTVALGDLKVNDRNVETIDLVPTIADLLGIAVPWKIDGTSVVGIAAKEPATKTMFYDMARRRRDYDKRGPDLSAALQDKLDTFGRSAIRITCRRPRGLPASSDSPPAGFGSQTVTVLSPSTTCPTSRG